MSIRCRHCREIVTDDVPGAGWLHEGTGQRQCGPVRGPGFVATPNLPVLKEKS